MCEICSKLTINTPEWRHSGFFVANFEQISHIVLAFPILIWASKRQLERAYLLTSLLKPILKNSFLNVFRVFQKG